MASIENRDLDAAGAEALGNHVPAKTALCPTCGDGFTPRRSTARYCGDACRKAAQRNRDRGLPDRAPTRAPAAVTGALLSVTGTPHTCSRNATRSVTLTPQGRRASKLDPRIVPDAKWPDMYRLRDPDGRLSDMVNLTRAKDALLPMWGRS
jgi:hypothetical protein